MAATYDSITDMLTIGADAYSGKQFLQALAVAFSSLTTTPETAVIRNLTVCPSGQGKCVVKPFLIPNVTAYSDRTYPITFVPSYLRGKPYLQLANDMKTAKESVLVSFTMNYTGKLFLAVKKGLEPAWIKSGWAQPNTSGRDSLDMAISGRTVSFDIYQCAVQKDQEVRLQSPVPGDAMYLVVFGG